MCVIHFFLYLTMYLFKKTLLSLVALFLWIIFSRPRCWIGSSSSGVGSTSCSLETLKSIQNCLFSTYRRNYQLVFEKMKISLASLVKTNFSRTSYRIEPFRRWIYFLWRRGFVGYPYFLILFRIILLAFEKKCFNKTLFHWQVVTSGGHSADSRSRFPNFLKSKQETGCRILIFFYLTCFRKMKTWFYSRFSLKLFLFDQCWSKCVYAVRIELFGVGSFWGLAAIFFFHFLIRNMLTWVWFLSDYIRSNCFSVQLAFGRRTVSAVNFYLLRNNDSWFYTFMLNIFRRICNMQEKLFIQ